MQKIQKIVAAARAELYGHYYSTLYIIRKAAPQWAKDGDKNYSPLETFHTYTMERLAEQERFLLKLKETLQKRTNYRYREPSLSALMPAAMLKMIEQRVEKVLSAQILTKQYSPELFKRQFDFHLQSWFKKYPPLIACLQVYARVESYYQQELCSEELSLLEGLLDLQIGQLKKLRALSLDSFHNNWLVKELKERELRQREAAIREKRRLKNNSHELTRRLGTYYRLLKVPPCSPLSVVKQSWKSQVKRCHPDFYTYDQHKQEEAKRFTQRLNSAYQEIVSCYKMMKIVVNGI